MAKTENTVSITDEKLSLGGDKPTVLARICLPHVTKDAPAPFAKSFTAYYNAMREGFLQYLEGTLVKNATASAKEEGFKPYGAVLSCTVGLETEGVLSLYTDVIISTDDKKHLHRTAALWRKDMGVLLKGAWVFEKGSTKKLYPLLASAAETYAAKTNSPLYSDYDKQLKKHFSQKNFYLSPKGVVFFYQAGAISSLQKPLPLHLPMETVKPCLKGEFLELVTSK